MPVLYVPFSNCSSALHYTENPLCPLTISLTNCDFLQLAWNPFQTQNPAQHLSSSQSQEQHLKQQRTKDVKYLRISVFYFVKRYYVFSVT